MTDKRVSLERLDYKTYMLEDKNCVGLSLLDGIKCHISYVLGSKFEIYTEINKKSIILFNYNNFFIRINYPIDDGNIIYLSINTYNEDSSEISAIGSVLFPFLVHSIEMEVLKNDR